MRLTQQYRSGASIRSQSSICSMRLRAMHAAFAIYILRGTVCIITVCSGIAICEETMKSFSISQHGRSEGNFCCSNTTRRQLQQHHCGLILHQCALEPFQLSNYRFIECCRRDHSCSNNKVVNFVMVLPDQLYYVKNSWPPATRNLIGPAAAALPILLALP